MMTNESSQQEQTTVRRSWPLSDTEDVETVKTALELLEIPYTLSFDGGLGSYGPFSSWSIQIAFTGEPVAVALPDTTTGETP